MHGSTRAADLHQMDVTVWESLFIGITGTVFIHFTGSYIFLLFFKLFVVYPFDRKYIVHLKYTIWFAEN